MRIKILFIIAIFGAFSAAFAEDLLERQFTPINSLTESLLLKSKPQISSLSDTATAFPTTSSSSGTHAISSSTTLANSSAAQAKSKPNPYNLPDKLMPLWDSMTLRQKAAQMIMVFLTTSQFVIENEIGGVLITGKHLSNAESYQKKISEINDSLQIPLFVATDQEGGIVNRLRSHSTQWNSLPSAREMRGMDTAKIHSLSNKIGRALKEIKINMNDFQHQIQFSSFKEPFKNIFIFFKFLFLMFYSVKCYLIKLFVNLRTNEISVQFLTRSRSCSTTQIQIHNKLSLL